MVYNLLDPDTPVISSAQALGYNMSSEKLDQREPLIHGAAVLAPDTTDWNFNEIDQDLHDLFAFYLRPKIFGHLTPYLSELGEIDLEKLD